VEAVLSDHPNLMKSPYIVPFDAAGAYKTTRYAICWQPFRGSSPVWFTGNSMTSAALKPRIKYFVSEEAAKKALPKAIALAEKCLTATY
jgi:hypothetical protein